MGEVAAAVVAGGLSRADGVQVICRRSRLLGSIAGAGAMAMVELPMEQVQLVPEVSVAVELSPCSTVVAGDADRVHALIKDWEALGVVARPVAVDVASHCSQVDPVLARLAGALADLRPGKFGVPFYSTVAEDPRAPVVLDADYWVANLRRPVRMRQAVAAAVADGMTAFVEVSPHPVLTHAVGDTLKDAGCERGVVLPSLRRDQDEQRTLRTQVAALHCHGHPVDWDRLVPPGRVVDLPTTAWQHERYWIDSTTAADAPPSHAHPLLGGRIDLANAPDAHVWHTEIDVRHLPWLSDHRVGGRTIMPGAAFFEMCLAAADALVDGPAAVTDFRVHLPLELGDVPAAVQTIATPGDEGVSLEIYARLDAPVRTEWALYATATLAPAAEAASLPAGQGPGTPDDLTEVPAADHYAGLAERGLDFGDSFRAVRRLWRRDGRAVGEVGLPEPLRWEAGRYRVHPVLLDACFQVMSAAVPTPREEEPVRRLLVGVGSAMIEMTRPPATAATAVATVERQGDDLVAGVEICAPDGARFGKIAGIRMRPDRSAPAAVPQDWVHTLVWRARPAPAEPAEPVGRWLLIADETGVAEAFAARLAAAGCAGRTVPAAALAGREEGELPELLGPLDDIDRVLHLGALNLTGGGAESGVEARTLVLDLINLARLLSRASGIRLRVVTRHAQAVRGDEPVDPAAAAVWGVGRGLALELPESWGGVVDLDEEDPRTCAARLCAAADEREVAFRDGTPHVPRLVRGRLPDPDEFALAASGCHLVVGASGTIGPYLLPVLTDLGARHLVLVSRRGLVGRLAEVVDDLRSQGITVTGVRADVADENAMKVLFARFGDDLPELRGIYNLASAGGSAELDRLGEDEVAAMFGPKVLGSAVLHRLSAGHPVERFVCFSSTTGLLGSRGYVHYAAASCFVDALVHARRAAGLPATVINWGVWRDWLSTSPDRAQIEGSGLRPMADELAVRAVPPVLAADPPQTVIASADWAALAGAYRSRDPLHLLDELVPAATAAAEPSSDVPERLRSVSAAQRREVLREHIRAEAADVMRMPSPRALNPTHGFFQLGMDSLMSVQLHRRLAAGLRCELSQTAIYNHPTVERLTEHLLTLLHEPEPEAEPPAPEQSPSELLRMLSERLDELS
jgi:acyl transferase domain-containing protein